MLRKLLAFLAATPLFASFTPSYERVSCCEQTFFVTADFLFWQAWTDDNDYAWKMTSVNPTDLSLQSVDRIAIDQKWAPGFRLGLGYGFCGNGWSLSLDWTRYHKSDSSSKRELEPTLALILVEPLDEINLRFGGLRAESAQAKYSLKYDTLDFQLGRDYWISHCLRFYPFLGLRVGWIDQEVKAEYNNVFAPETNLPYMITTFVGDRIVTRRDQMWGIGPRLGFTSNWELGCDFSLIGEIAGSIVWADFDRSINQFSFDPTLTPSEFTEKVVGNNNRQLWPNVQMAVGIDWGTLFCECMFFGLELKYEATYWWENPVSQLSLQGLTLSGRLEF